MIMAAKNQTLRKLPPGGQGAGKRRFVEIIEAFYAGGFSRLGQMEGAVVHQDKVILIQNEGQVHQVFNGTGNGAEQAGIIGRGLHAVQLFRVIGQNPRHKKVVVSSHRWETEGAHACQGAVAKRQPSYQISHAVDGISLDTVHMPKAGFKGVGIAMDVAEKTGAHILSYSSTVSKVPSSFWMIFICRPLGSVNLIAPP